MRETLAVDTREQGTTEGVGMRRLGRALAVLGPMLLATAGPAPAATTIGDSTFTPSGTCNGIGTYAQIASPGGQFAAPSAGIITSWTFGAGTTPATSLEFKVLRAAGGDSFITIAESEPRAMLANQANTFPTRLVVGAGDVIGFFAGPGVAFACNRPTTPGAGYVVGTTGSDLAVGSGGSYNSAPDLEFAVSAQLEPDADGDGFGDESQDSCPLDTAAQAVPCPDRAAPNTFITERPEKKTTKKTATFEFDSSESGSSFACSVDGGAFKPCSSPHTILVRRGKHTFGVRATDAAGNADSTPAEKAWKVTRKKRK